MPERPLRVVVDKYARTAKLNGSPYTPQSFHVERERTLIVYGTRDEEAANRAMVEEFHRANAARQADWPSTMTTLSTHDTKRGEDVRARLAVLAEIPADWAGALLTLVPLGSRSIAKPRTSHEVAPAVSSGTFV